ncbi:exosome complex component CSL4 [Epargyreus clarus]|uniref:exosome complex component CSL4 n=1 Tax=Epargyreus clarus TaxID=520877 RepID=UPI003C2C539A
MEEITSKEVSSQKYANVGDICGPGIRLSVSNDKFIPGTGTYEIIGYIYASVVGVLTKTVDEKTMVTTVSVLSPKPPSYIPKTGDIITGRVTMVNPRMAYCLILCINENVITRPCKGIIKKEEMRQIDKDQIDPYKCFKTGDIILAKVLPNKEVHHYLLSTAENELGVVIAKAEGAPLGVNMVPVSWSEMQCPKTLVREKRKVARVMPESLDHVLLMKENVETQKENRNTNNK